MNRDVRACIKKLGTGADHEADEWLTFSRSSMMDDGKRDVELHIWNIGGKAQRREIIDERLVGCSTDGEKGREEIA